MIKEYSNGESFVKDNSSFLDLNKYMSAFIYLDAKLLGDVDKKNYCLKSSINDKQLLGLKLEPYKLLLYGDIECLSELLDYLESNDYECDGIQCSMDLGIELVNKRGYKETLGMDFMEAKEKTIESSALVSKLSLDDVKEIYDLSLSFMSDCGLSDKVKEENIIKRLSNYRVIKKDGRIISMAGLSIDTKESMRITYVYTRPEYRGKGYAKKVVNYIKNEIIDMGLTATLNVDRKNPISNHLYESLGFKKVFSQGVYIKE